MASRASTVEPFLRRTVKDRVGCGALITLVEVEIDVPVREM
jgi:hypothetical protein